ncbi:hypothetical protein ACFYYS_18085 [Streptomyces sp. NPDC002120]|uniref:hypothetical protein n=1 Tax=Streptomyces sp. NPDC002120 TaxID=3364631 RepID=UPI0036A4F69E
MNPETFEPAPFNRQVAADTPGEASSAASDFLQWLSEPIDEFPEAEEQADENLEALLLEIKARGRAMRQDITRGGVDAPPGGVAKATTSEFRPLRFPQIREADALGPWGPITGEIISHAAPSNHSVDYSDFVKEIERWFVPRAPSKWKWTPTGDPFDVELALHSADSDLGIDAPAADARTGGRFDVQMKWASSTDSRVAGLLALESLRRTAEQPEVWVVMLRPLDAVERPPVVPKDVGPRCTVVREGESSGETLMVLFDFATGRRPETAHDLPRRNRDTRWSLALQQMLRPSAVSVKHAVRGTGKGVKKERAGLRSPRRRGTRVPERAAPPTPAAVVVVDGSTVDERLRPQNDDAAVCFYLALPEQLTPAKEHLPQVREFWHSTLQTYIDEGAIARSAM